jgi:hypothetical protein
MKQVETKLALALTLLLGGAAAYADGESSVPRGYSASSAYWSWVESMQFAPVQAEPKKSAARPYSASDGYWVWMENMNFAPVTAPQTAGRPYSASDGYWAWVDGMEAQGAWVGTKAKAKE